MCAQKSPCHRLVRRGLLGLLLGRACAFTFEEFPNRRNMALVVSLTLTKRAVKPAKCRLGSQDKPPAAGRKPRASKVGVTRRSKRANALDEVGLVRGRCVDGRGRSRLLAAVPKRPHERDGGQPAQYANGQLVGAENDGGQPTHDFIFVIPLLKKAELALRLDRDCRSSHNASRFGGRICCMSERRP